MTNDSDDLTSTIVFRVINDIVRDLQNQKREIVKKILFDTVGLSTDTWGKIALKESEQNVFLKELKTEHAEEIESFKNNLKDKFRSKSAWKNPPIKDVDSIISTLQSNIIKEIREELVQELQPELKQSLKKQVIEELITRDSDIRNYYLKKL